MIFFCLFLAELGLLLYLSRVLIKNLARLFYKLFHSHGGVVNCLAILFLPGTIIHELSHLLVAGVMLVPVGELNALPQIQENGVQLGSVQIGQTDPFRRALIGVAPVLVGLSIILGVIFFNKDYLLDLSQIWRILLTLYILFEVSNTMFSSKRDMEGVISFGVAILIVAALVLGALLLSGHQNWLRFLVNLNYSGVENFFQTGSFFMPIPLGLDLGLIGLTKLSK